MRAAAAMLVVLRLHRRVADGRAYCVGCGEPVLVRLRAHARAAAAYPRVGARRRPPYEPPAEPPYEPA